MKTTEQTKDYYNAIAQGYAELYHAEQQEKIEAVLEWLPKSGTVIDCGAGDGVINSYLTNIHLTSCDLSSELLARNNARTKVCCSLEDLPFENQEFDSFVSFTVVQDVTSIEQAIKEIARVVRQGGVLSILKMSSRRELIERELKKYFIIADQKELLKDVVYRLEKTI